MRIRYISDIHLEFIKPNKIDNYCKKILPVAQNEICVLAGDIGNPYSENYDKFMKGISANFEKTFVIAGNHEYYNKYLMYETDNYLKQYFQQFPNISFLHNSCEQYNNYNFIGTTLWSKITNPAYEINDVYSIQNFDYVKYNKLHKTALEFLEDAIQKSTNNIIITHHGPSMSLIDKKYLIAKLLPYNQWFYSDLDDLIQKYQQNIACWFYGHTHTPSISNIHNIPFLCNPIGYPNENPKTDWSKYFDV